MNTPRQPIAYADIFAYRGDSYAAAMALAPAARASEFSNLLRDIDTSGLRNVADVPSGGGYLAPYLPDGVRLDAYDPAEAFRAAGRSIFPVDLSAPRLARRDYDLVACLASIHHVEDKGAFFAALAEHVAPGGSIVIADVPASSRIAGFLDHFIGLHNGTGHDGLYLGADDPFAFGRDHQRVVDAQVALRPCPWVFADEAEMVAFCRLLFGTPGLAPGAMVEALESRVGVTREGGEVRVEWELAYITARLD